MLLRMYLRWSSDRGFQTELVEASPGEEAGLKSATMTVKGENAYGAYKAERGVHRLVRQSPFDSRPPPPHGVRAGRRRAAPARGRGRRDRRERPARSTPTGRAAPAASTSTRPTRPSGSRTCRRASSSSARTSARRPRTRQTAMRILKSRLVELQEEEREAELARERGATQDIGFGSQIRSLRAASVPDGEGPPHRLRGGKRPGRARRRPRRLRARVPAREGRREGRLDGLSATLGRQSDPERPARPSSSRDPVQDDDLQLTAPATALAEPSPAYADGVGGAAAVERRVDDRARGRPQGLRART